jgi:hypothetical protein
LWNLRRRIDEGCRFADRCRIANRSRIVPGVVRRQPHAIDARAVRLDLKQIAEFTRLAAAEIAEGDGEPVGVGHVLGVEKPM